MFRLQPLPAVPIKDEPIDDTDDDFQMKCIDESDDMMDPTMFLERSEHEGDVPLMVNIQALTYWTLNLNIINKYEFEQATVQVKRQSKQKRTNLGLLKIPRASKKSQFMGFGGIYITLQHLKFILLLI